VGSRWVVTGSNGQLGRALVESLAQAPGRELVASADHPRLDVSDADAVERFFGDLPARPDFLVNAAAFTQVDRCEREPELARQSNAVAPRLLALACRDRGVRLVHVSTDYVFDGEGRRPYREDDEPAPRSAYGRTKLEGERAVLDTSPDFLVVRSSWIFGDGRNFIAAILNQARQRRSGRATGPLRVVDDQTGQPTYAVDLAPALQDLSEAGASGLIHVAGGGIATWWDVARVTLDEAGYSDLGIERLATSELTQDAPRPTWSVLDCSKAASRGVKLRPWREALRAFLKSSASPVSGAGIPDRA